LAIWLTAVWPNLVQADGFAFRFDRLFGDGRCHNLLALIKRALFTTHLTGCNARQFVFLKDKAYSACECVIGVGLTQFSGELYSYQWMTNYWHLVLSHEIDGDMSRSLLDYEDAYCPV